MKQLRYVIAGLGLNLHSRDNEKLKNYLTSFSPFCVNEFSKDTIHLFDFFTGLTLDVNGEPIHSFDWEGIKCEIFMNDNHYLVKFYLSQDEYYIIKSDKQWKIINSNIQTIDERSSFCITFFLMFAYCFASIPYNTLVIHASVVIHNEKAMVFQGKSGTGKSTHSQLWLKNVKGTYLLNDDNPVIRIDDSGILYVYGSPWSGKTPCYLNKKFEVAAFVRLSQAKENKLQKLSLGKSFASLLPSCSNMIWDKRVHETICSTISKVCIYNRCWTLQCLADKDAVMKSKSIIDQLDDIDNDVTNQKTEIESLEI